MTLADTPLLLKTELASAPVRIPDLVHGDGDKIVMAKLSIVKGIALATGELYENPSHSYHLNEVRLDGTKAESTVTLPSEKALRLVSAYQKLKPEHNTDCHDFTATAAGWALRKEQPMQWEEDHIENSSEVEAGSAYGVIAQLSKRGERGCTHSGIGTDSGELLGVLGRNSALAVIDLETAQSIYSRGGETFMVKLLGQEAI